MSTIPLRIDADLVNTARESASLMERTTTAQIEFWAKLGRVVETVLSHDSVTKVKASARVQDLDELLAKADSPEGRELARAEIARHGVPVYSTDPAVPGIIIETRPDGSERRGKFVNRRFMPVPERTLG